MSYRLVNLNNFNDEVLDLKSKSIKENKKLNQVKQNTRIYLF